MSESGDTGDGPASGDAGAVSRQLRGGSLLLVGRLLAKGLNFAVQVAIVRLLTKDEFGAFAYGLALVLAGELVVKGGLGRGANRFVPYYVERGERAEVMGTLALVTGVIVVLGLVGFGVLVGVSRLGLAGFPSGEGGRVVLLLAVLAPVQALDTIGIQALACFSRPREIFFRKHVLAPVLRLLAVALVFALGGDGAMLALAYVAGGVLGLVICLQLVVRQLFVHGVLPLPISAWRVPWRPLIRFSLPLISSDLVFIVMTFVTTVVLMTTDGEQGVASMRAVVPAAMLNLLVVQSFSMLFLPAAMRFHARGDRASLAAHHWQSVAWVSVLSFPIFALTSGVAPAFVPIVFGEAYADSAPLLAILSVGYFAGVCMAFNGETLQVFHRTRAIVGTDLLAIGASLALAFLLCPRWGALGAALAVTVARIASTIARQIVVLRAPDFGRVPPAQKRVWAKLALASAAVAALGWTEVLPVWGQVLATALVSLALLRSTAASLDVARSFPELLRLPFFAKLVGV
ncbi:MAG TPA: flippase [Myxococcota bacterium]|nr:flippase [Myxococcota bacterium]